METLLDRLAQRDLLQPRPLIWKARFLLDSGRVDEAEKTVRAAIAMAPWDGGLGAGDPAVAHSILAEVLEKKGDAQAAKAMRASISAMRQSERASEWRDAGLLTEYAKRHEAALLDDPDLYLVQHRQALASSQLGRHKAAEQHLRRAFELMPGSTGRLSGQDVGFAPFSKGRHARSLADQVLTQLAARSADDASVHYWLGRLRDAQGRHQEAAAAYRAAVKLDADHLSAWQALAFTADRVPMPPAESETAALQMVRLDPAGSHSSPEMKNVHDFRRLWTLLLEIDHRLPPAEVGPLLPLQATQARVDLIRDSGGNVGIKSYETPFSYRLAARRHLSNNALLRTLVMLVELRTGC